MTIASVVRRIGQVSLAGLWLIAGVDASAATWVLGSASGQPGEAFDLPVSFRGDGRTVAADIGVLLDPARLTIDAPAGELPASGPAGRCGWSGAGNVGALLYSAANEPLPSGDTLVCLLRVRIRPTAPAGVVTLRAHAAHCATADGHGGACTVDTGTVEIRGPLPESRPSSSDSLSLVVLLDSNAPPARELIADGAGNSAVDAFRRAPPRALRALFAAVDPQEGGLPGDADDPVLQARMARYLVADYDSLVARDHARELLLSDPLVIGASPDTGMAFASGGVAQPKATLQQEHLGDLDVQSLWLRAGGWGLVGAVDSGITAEHPELRSFTGPKSASGTWVPGGNYLPYFSSNLGLKGQLADDLSETQASQANADDTCGIEWMDPPWAGHGTHVSGLIAANAGDGTGAAGTCRHCGIGMRKTSFVKCLKEVGPFLHNNASRAAVAIEAHALEGVQAINLSLAAFRQYCHYVNGSPDIQSVCDAMALALNRDVLIVAAAGNNLDMVGFPATDPRVLSVGGIVGLDQNGAPVWWTESPNCPLPPSGQISKPECGSNYRQSVMPGNPPPFSNYIELSAHAKSVTSTFVPGWDWHDGIACGDSHDGTDGDGFGPCTGTSMSTPQVSGLVGVLRSIHPLVVAGTPWTNPATGIRGLLRATASRTLAGQNNDPRLGFGIPNAWMAADRLLGAVGGEIAKNRVTPLFGLYSPGLDDYAAVATPQLAMALRNVMPAANTYRSVHQGSDNFVQGLPIPGYAAFPGVGAGPPRALAFLLTTEHSRAGLPTPVPLYLLARPRAQAATADDHILVDQSLVQKAANAGYAFAGRQGFVYPWCASPGCNPEGTQPLHLKCKNAANPVTRRCAVFLESQRPAFESKGYTALFPGALRSQLGFAYPVADADNDGLVDAAEWVIGTSVAHKDSDGDGINDASEYPLAGIPVSDPCQGPSVKCPHILDRIFRDGFE